MDQVPHLPFYDSPAPPGLYYTDVVLWPVRLSTDDRHKPRRCKEHYRRAIVCIRGTPVTLSEYK